MGLGTNTLSIQATDETKYFEESIEHLLLKVIILKHVINKCRFYNLGKYLNYFIEMQIIKLQTSYKQPQALLVLSF